MDSPSESPVQTCHETRCCIVGGGPAGLILGLLFARTEIPVTLLESHADFDRDFRGDTVHPPTLELMAQLGLSERLHAFPHGKVRAFSLHTPSGVVTMADLRRLQTPFPYIMTLPQARFLETVANEACQYPNFRLVMQANVQRLIEEGGQVRGIRYREGNNTWHEVRADLVVAADGRFSKIRHLVGIEPERTAPPMDVVWFRLPRKQNDPAEGAEIYIGGGHFSVLLDRGEEWQIGHVILKGTFASLKEKSIASLRDSLKAHIPWMGDRVDLLTDWKQVVVLNVESSRVPCWHKPGLLLIGDAAHVMSPVAGVGINVAIQDAVAAANELAEPLRQGRVQESDLARVQEQREPAVRWIQWIQSVIQNRIAAPGLTGKEFQLPLLMRLALSLPGIRTIPSKMLVMGPHRVRLKESLARAGRTPVGVG